jgi:hypothetical protein
MRINILQRVVDLARRGSVGVDMRILGDHTVDGVLLGMVRRIIAVSHKAVPWAAGDGADCPVCLEVLRRRHRGRVTHTGSDGVRYLECRHCSTTFKAIAPAAPEKKKASSKTPENLKRKRARA